MNERFALTHAALTLRYWQACVTFGKRSTGAVLGETRWLAKYARVIEGVREKDLRSSNDVVLPGEIVFEIAGEGHGDDEFYADPDAQRLYAVARRREGKEPSSADTDGLEKVATPEALLSYGAFCLFMSSDRSIGYRREKDEMRFGSLEDSQPARTKLLWTIDDRGAHFVLEQRPWNSSRGIVSHNNLSVQAYFGGEAWRTGHNEMTINAACRAFGYSRDHPAAENERRYAAAVKYLRDQGLKVNARPLGTR
jgi:hypothetical protein